MLRHDEMEACSFAWRAKQCDLSPPYRFIVQIFEMLDDHIARTVEQSRFERLFIGDPHDAEMKIIVALRHFADGKNHRGAVVVTVSKGDSLHRVSNFPSHPKPVRGSGNRDKERSKNSSTRTYLPCSRLKNPSSS